MNKRFITQIGEITKAMKVQPFLTRISLLLLLAVTSCSAINRMILPEAPETKTTPAVVRVRSLLLRDNRNSISIKSIDGQPPTLLEYKWVITPGPHTLDVEVHIHEDSEQVRDRTYVTKIRREVDMVAEPYGEYVVDARKVDSTVYIWVADEKSRRVIAGEAPHGNALPGFERTLER